MKIRTIGCVLITLSVLAAAGPVRADDVHYDLTARMNGSATLSDGTQITTWGFRLGSGMGGFPQVPGPTIVANEGDRVFLHFRNMSMMPHTIHPHGVDADQQNDGVPQTSFEIPMMGSYTYEFTAPHAGTYAYHCHVETVIHLQMGMYGAIIILPPDGSNHAWQGGPAFDFERTWLTAEIDRTWNQLQTNANFTVYEPDYFLVNGKDGSHIAVDPYTTFDIDGDGVVLLRLGNMGYLPVRYDFTGLSTEVIASDGRPLPAVQAGTGLEIAPGERYDVLVRGVAAGNYIVTIDYLDLYDGSIQGSALVPVNVTGSPTGVAGESPPAKLALSGPHPSPFSNEVEFDVQVPGNGPIDVWIYDTRGRLLHEERALRGDASMIRWDGTDRTGTQVPSGVYYLRVRHEGEFLSRKMTLVR